MHGQMKFSMVILMNYDETNWCWAYQQDADNNKKKTKKSKEDKKEKSSKNEGNDNNKPSKQGSRRATSLLNLFTSSSSSSPNVQGRSTRQDWPFRFLHANLLKQSHPFTKMNKKKTKQNTTNNQLIQLLLLI